MVGEIQKRQVKVLHFLRHYAPHHKSNERLWGVHGIIVSTHNRTYATFDQFTEGNSRVLSQNLALKWREFHRYRSPTIFGISSLDSNFTNNK